MKKLLLIVIYILCSVSLFAQVKSQQVWATKELRSDGYMLINGDTLQITSPSDGEILQRVGGVWINTASSATGVVDSVNVVHDANFSVEHLYYYVDGTPYYITSIHKPDALDGGYVTWNGDLNFTISPAYYTLSGTDYTSGTTNITLSTADATYDRFDVFVVNDQGIATVIEGTPAASPQKPSIDPSSEIELTYVLVKANATVPSNPSTGTTVTSELVYDENTEWETHAVIYGGSVDYSSTTNPYANSISADATTVRGGDYLSFLNDDDINVSDITGLSFMLQLKAGISNQFNFYLSFLKDGFTVSNPAKLTINKSSTSWQLVGLDLTTVTFSGTQIDGIKLVLEKTGTNTSVNGFYLDLLQLQGNFTQTSTVSDITGNEPVFDGWDKDVSDDFSGDYNDLINTPTIPTALSQLTDDATHRLVTDTEKATWDSKLSAEVDGSVTNELQIISTTGAAGNITLSNDGGTLNLNVNDADASTTNELQTLDVAQLTGTNLELSLSSDGEATHSIDLSSLQDGTGTDDQTAEEVSVVVQNGIEQNNVQAELEAIRGDIAIAGDGWGSDVVNHDTTLSGSGIVSDPLGVNSITASMVSDFDAEVSNNTSVTANTAKVTNATHTGEVTGSTALTISDDVIDYGNVAPTLKDTLVDNDLAWDYEAAGIVYSSITGGGTIALTNGQINKTMLVVLTVSSFTSITIPAEIHVLGGTIEADGTYYLYLHCIGTNNYTLSIQTEQ